MTSNPSSPAVAVPSLPEVYRTIEIPRAGTGWRRFLAFLGPGYLVSVGYMVPMLLNAASEGLLVLVSFVAASTTEAVQRFIDISSPELRQSVQGAMPKWSPGTTRTLRSSRSLLANVVELIAWS